jgi:hypothetical protein
LEARKIAEKWSPPWQSNPVYSSGVKSLWRYVEPNMKNFPTLKTPGSWKEWENIEKSESSNEASSQPIGWNPGRRQWKMTTDNSKTEISEPSPSNVEKRNSWKGQTVSEKSLDELVSIQMENEVKNVLVTIINLVINSRDAKAVVRHLWKAVELH